MSESNQIQFFIGGCRSGKSSAALRQANQIEARRRIFVATCQPHDDEMRARIDRHRRERDAGWETIEEPLDIAAVIEHRSASRTVILVDCLTLWLTNLILTDAGDDMLEKRFAALQQALSAAAGPVILVANEVGLGIVPDNALSRRFRDWAGSLNQKVAQWAGEVVMTVAGIPVTIKPAGGEDPSSHP